jgi:TPR repeat protein
MQLLTCFTIRKNWGNRQIIMRIKLNKTIFFCLNIAISFALIGQTAMAESASPPADEVVDLQQVSTVIADIHQEENTNVDVVSEIQAPDQTTTQTIEAIVDVPKPIKNPHSLLVEMAFKFGKPGGKVSSYQEVYEQYCLAAREGDADAQYAMGWIYEHGKGIAKDVQMAHTFYSMAAEQQHSLALEAISETTVVKLDGDKLSDLPKCMQPDPVIVIEKPIQNEIAPVVEENPISEKTAFLFMSQKRIYQIVNKVATKHKIDPNLVMTFIAIESGFDPNATSIRNAQGLMQLIPETAARFGVKDAYKPEDNIKGGVAYLNWLLAYYQGNVELVAAAYNAGEKAVDRYKGVPPYEETKRYVKKIAKLYNRVKHPFRENWVEASPILESFTNMNNKRRM